MREGINRKVFVRSAVLREAPNFCHHINLQLNTAGKPYVDYFLAHVQMTLRDFTYGVHSLSSISSLKPVK